MDQRERMNDYEEALRAAIDDAMANAWHCLPAIVQSFNAQKMTCVALIAIKMTVRDSVGKTTQRAITPLVDVPVLFPGGGGFLVTFPLAQGDEVLVVFADRCIDSWWQSGAGSSGNPQPQAQAEQRMHDLSDGFAIPKVWSVPSVPIGVSSTTAQLRSKDGTTYVELAAGGIINIHAPGGLNLNGALIATGEITAKNMHTVSAHVHGGVTTGSGITGGPTG